MKDVERTTIEAALTGSRALADPRARAASARPVGESRREIFDGYRARLPELAAAFGRSASGAPAHVKGGHRGGGSGGRGESLAR